MSTPHSATVPDFQTWALAVADVGTWRCSLSEGWVRGDAVMAAMFGFTDGEAQNGITFARLREIIHPEDRHIFDRKNERMGEVGGHIVMEYRIAPRPGTERLVLVRGRYDQLPPNSLEGMTGHGIVIDITATKKGAPGEDGRLYVTAGLAEEEMDALDGAANAALALHRAVDRPGARELPGLREAVNIVLRLIGHGLADQIGSDDLD